MIQFIKGVVNSTLFEKFIVLIILINCFFVGVETYTINDLTQIIQFICLLIFTIEVILRLISSNSIKSYFCDSWNVFDLSIVLICFIPESLFENTSTITTLRVLRVFRVLRLL